MTGYALRPTVMTGISASTDAAPQQPAPPPSLRALLRRHKLVSLALLVVVLLCAAIVVPEVLSAGSLKVTDSTSCAAWSSATPREEGAYARLYIQRHGSLAGGATNVARIESQVNNGCMQAFSYDEADTITVLQAIQGRY